MDKQQAAINAFTSFIKAADSGDLDGLGDIMHKDFQNIQGGFFDKKGIYVIPKDEYIGYIRSGEFGGKPRTIQIEAVEDMGDVVHIKAILESEYLVFKSFITMVCENDKWQVITNLPSVQVK